MQSHSVAWRQHRWCRITASCAKQVTVLAQTVPRCDTTKSPPPSVANFLNLCLWNDASFTPKWMQTGLESEVTAREHMMYQNFPSQKLELGEQQNVRIRLQLWLIDRSIWDTKCGHSGNKNTEGSTRHTSIWGEISCRLWCLPPKNTDKCLFHSAGGWLFKIEAESFILLQSIVSDVCDGVGMMRLWVILTKGNIKHWTNQARGFIYANNDLSMPGILAQIVCSRNLWHETSKRAHSFGVMRPSEQCFERAKILLRM